MDKICVMEYGMIIMFIIIIFLIINQRKTSKNKESFALGAEDLSMVRNEINRIYDMDVEAIRNLGHISKTLLTGTNTFTASANGTPGQLTIPANNTVFQGGVTIGNLTIRPDGTMIMGNLIINTDGSIKLGTNLMINSGGSIGNLQVNGGLVVDGPARINGFLSSTTRIIADGIILVGNAIILNSNGSINTGSINCTNITSDNIIANQRLLVSDKISLNTNGYIFAKGYNY